MVLPLKCVIFRLSYLLSQSQDSDSHVFFWVFFWKKYTKLIHHINSVQLFKSISLACHTQVHDIVCYCKVINVEKKREMANGKNSYFS